MSGDILGKMDFEAINSLLERYYSKYNDCVMKEDEKNCYGLTDMLCQETGKCNFYKSNKYYIRDEDGYIERCQFLGEE